MVSYQNILYCTDYSEDADIAFIYAVDMAERYGAKLHILHVVDSVHRYQPSETGEDQEEGVFASVTPELLDQITEKVKNQYQARLGGIKEVAWKVLPGVPFVEIIRYAKDNQIDLIVMGSTGKSELDRTTYGSTVENVSRRAHCHVMAIRNPEKVYTR